MDKVEIEGKCDHICGTVPLTSFSSKNVGREVAARVIAAALNRLVYHHDVAIQDARNTGEDFSPIDPQPGGMHHATSNTLDISHEVTLVVGAPPAHLKGQLEQATQPGERHFGLFRSALLSAGPVEAFMHLHNLLIMLLNDKQALVDAFIIAEEPTVPQMPHPLKPSGVMETVYTRLRNEFAHTRPGVNLANTKAEMIERLDGLTALTRKAIEQIP